MIDICLIPIKLGLGRFPVLPVQSGVRA
uniref:Uncharacterized protein n=1 Tax=Anguilla anguilla TaxID=7936 RepID=A0A0E9UTJ1_ANGAN